MCFYFMVLFTKKWTNLTKYNRWDKCNSVLFSIFNLTRLVYSFAQKLELFWHLKIIVPCMDMKIKLLLCSATWRPKIFGPLKAAWKTAVRKHKDNVQITRSNITKVFVQAFETSMKKTIIVTSRYHNRPIWMIRLWIVWE